LRSSEGQETLFSEEGTSSAKCFALGASLSLVAKGKHSKVQSNVAYFASQALNSFSTIRALSLSQEEGVISSMILQRVYEGDSSSIPKNMDEYNQVMEALKTDCFDNPIYKKLAG
jgi:hypothetical protein